MAMVALEQHFPESKRIITDELAYPILPLSARIQIWIKLRLMSVEKMVDWTEKRMPGMWSGFMCRKRYIDEKVTKSVEDVDSVVNLGAGFDTRAYRLPTLSEIPVWEVDLPGNIETKRSRLMKVLDGIPDNVTLVPVDFDRQDLGRVLASAGFSSDARTFFIWEAVSQYLTEVGIEKTMAFLATAQTGSRLAFTYIQKGFVEGTSLLGHEYLYERMVEKNRSWFFGIDPANVADFLDRFGWRLEEHLGYDDLADRYVKPTGRALLSTQLERMVFAVKS
jgi:methyltransferase (TIGR00027 family)